MREYSFENQARKVYKPICGLCHSAPCSNNMTRLVAKQGPLTADQVRGIIKKYDANNDGGLNKEELKDAFRALGARLPGWRARRAIHHADANGDGLIGEEEPLRALHHAGANGDGLIGEEELDSVMQYAMKKGYDGNMLYKN
ncbi:calmodulin-like protein 5 [Juglans microcarpa x Juglans regia]|uniref:calmodulin-like protein 5 n=1 Tax=Juglans microcarpa x Juglans regia TaxID=2249226 RepID=UPI001B7F35B8|nr:calmodulin-like protein 5 [Juglans microcarpa x Juglans regia]